MLIEFLIHRTGQKQLVLDTLLKSLKAKELRLRQIRKLFDLIVEKFSLSTGAQNNGLGELSICYVFCTGCYTPVFIPFCFQCLTWEHPSLHAYRECDFNSESSKPQLQPIPVHHLRIEQREMQSSIFIPMMVRVFEI